MSGREFQKPGRTKTGDPAFIAFAKSVLESEGIRYFTRGEGLQDLFAGGRFGTGFNPVIGPVQIQVDDREVEKAKEILRQIEEGQFELTENDTNRSQEHEGAAVKKRNRTGLLKGILIGVLVSAIAFFLYNYEEKHYTGIKKYDLNKDSNPDLFYVYKNGVLVRIEEDRNFDGIVDNWYYYTDEILTKGEIDTDSDKRPEIVEEYKNGVLAEISWYHESSRKIWKKAFFVGGIMREQQVDQDYDGTFDIKILYSTSERPIKTESLH